MQDPFFQIALLQSFALSHSTSHEALQVIPGTWSSAAHASPSTGEAGMKFGFIATSGTADQILELATETEAHGWDGFFHWDGIAPGSGEFWEDETGEQRT